MFSPITVLLASAVAAQAASSSASASASSPTHAASQYIPTSGISATCASFLDTLDTDTDLTSCTSSLMSTAAPFGPSGNATSADKSTISSALSSICSTTSSCPQSLIAGKLASFYTECGPELTSSPNDQVKTIYDTFYSLLPLLSSVCAKDDSGDWCVLSVNASSAASDIASPLSRRDTGEEAYMPNAATIDSNNLLFLLLNGSAPKDQLCTTCTRNVLTNYISFEGNTMYAPGLAQSVLMSGQPALYQGVVNTCGADFLTSAVKAAGGLGQGGTSGTSGALSLRAGGVLATLGALGVAVLAL